MSVQWTERNASGQPPPALSTVINTSGGDHLGATFSHRPLLSTERHDSFQAQTRMSLNVLSCQKGRGPANMSKRLEDILLFSHGRVTGHDPPTDLQRQRILKCVLNHGQIEQQAGVRCRWQWSITSRTHK